jgi:vanillate O-demethylase monooxygenase subunit
MYHGLKFDTKGVCVEIPGQDRIPPQARVRSYPVVEKNRWIWVWMGDPAKARAEDIPDTPWLTDSRWRGKEAYLHYKTNYLLICDNLLDFSHLPYVHAKTLGGSEDYAKIRPVVERLDRGVRVTRWVRDIDPPPFILKVKNWGKRVDRWNIYDFIVPGLLLMDSGMAPAGTGAPEGKRVDAAEFRSCQVLTPETENSTHYFFSHMHGFALDRTEVTDQIHQSILDAFEEDRRMITAQQNTLASGPHFKMMPLPMDNALTHFRQVIERLARDERDAQRYGAGEQPVSPLTRTSTAPELPRHF